MKKSKKKKKQLPVSAIKYREQYRKRCCEICSLLSHVNLQVLLEQGVEETWADEAFFQEAQAELAAHEFQERG